MFAKTLVSLLCSLRSFRPQSSLLNAPIYLSFTKIFSPQFRLVYSAPTMKLALLTCLVAVAFARHTKKVKCRKGDVFDDPTDECKLCRCVKKNSYGCADKTEDIPAACVKEVHECGSHGHMEFWCDGDVTKFCYEDEMIVSNADACIL